jgi:CheY-like chemotaxis protein
VAWWRQAILPIGGKVANRVLIISAIAADIRSLELALNDARDGPFDVESAASLAAGMKRICKGGIDAILLDLTLPDSAGLSSFDQCHRAARHTPILPLVKAIDGRPESNGAIVSAVIGMGKNLHQRVIAEGVENETQLGFLKAQGCNEGQGRLFSKPVAAIQMLEMLNAGVCA